MKALIAKVRDWFDKLTPAKKAWVVSGLVITLALAVAFWPRAERMPSLENYEEIGRNIGFCPNAAVVNLVRYNEKGSNPEEFDAIVAYVAPDAVRPFAIAIWDTDVTGGAPRIVYVDDNRDGLVDRKGAPAELGIAGFCDVAPEPNLEPARPGS